MIPLKPRSSIMCPKNTVFGPFLRHRRAGMPTTAMPIGNSANTRQHRCNSAPALWPLLLTRLAGRSVRAFLTSSCQAVLFRTIFVKPSLVYPLVALAAELLLDPFYYPMTIFISEILSHTFSDRLVTLAGIFALAFFALPL